MSDYTKATDFASKDALLTGNPAKLVKGTEIDTEFNNIAIAVATKIDDDAELAALAGLISAADKVPYFTGSGTAALADFSAAARTVMDDATVGDMRTTLSVPSIATTQDGKLNWVDGGGTADAITATYVPSITALVDGQLCCVRATAANATTTPTFAPNGLTARTIVKKGGSALVAGDIVADGHELILRYDLANTRWELLNPGDASYVVGPASSTDNSLARFDGTSGKLLKNGAVIGTDVQAYDANTAKTNVEQTFTAQQTPMNGTLTDGATIDWNGDSNGQSVKVTLGGNRTMNAPTNINEYAAYVIRVIQDGTGSRTLAWNSAFKFAGGTAPTLTTTASAVDVFTFIGGASTTLLCVGQTLDVK